MSDPVTITMDRADAEWFSRLADPRSQWGNRDAVTRIHDAIRATLAAAPRPAEAADGLDNMIRLEPELYAKMLRVAYHAMLAQEVPENRMVELQSIMTEAAGWPEDDRVVIDVLMEQWEEEQAAMAQAEGGQG